MLAQLVDAVLNPSSKYSLLYLSTAQGCSGVAATSCSLMNTIMVSSGPAVFHNDLGGADAGSEHTLY